MNYLLEQARKKSDDPRYLECIEKLIDCRREVDNQESLLMETLLAFELEYRDAIEPVHGSIQALIDEYGLADCLRYTNYCKGRIQVTSDIASRWNMTVEELVSFLGADAVITLASAIERDNIPKAIGYMHDAVVARSGIRPRSQQCHKLLEKARAKKSSDPRVVSQVRRMNTLEAQVQELSAAKRAAESHAERAERRAIEAEKHIASLGPAPDEPPHNLPESFDDPTLELQAVEQQIASTEAQLAATIAASRARFALILKPLRARRDALRARASDAAE